MSAQKWGRVGVAFAAVALGVAAVACSSGDDAKVASAASDAGPDANRRRDDEPAPDARSCIETCRADHADGVAKDQAIDACWATSCPVCAGGTPPNARADGGDTPVTCGSTPVVTPLAACDTCTGRSCCDAWEGCFEDATCRALNDCYQRCPSD